MLTARQRRVILNHLDDVPKNKRGRRRGVRARNAHISRTTALQLEALGLVEVKEGLEMDLQTPQTWIRLTRKGRQKLAQLKDR